MSFFLYYNLERTPFSTAEAKPKSAEKQKTPDELRQDTQRLEEQRRTLIEKEKNDKAQNTAENHEARIRDFLVSNNYLGLPENNLQHEDVIIGTIREIEEKYTACLNAKLAPENQQYFGVEALLQKGLKIEQLKRLIELKIQKEQEKAETQKVEKTADHTEKKQNEKENVANLKVNFDKDFAELYGGKKENLIPALRKIIEKYKDKPEVAEMQAIAEKWLRAMTDSRLSPAIQQKFTATFSASPDPFSEKTFTDTFRQTVLYPPRDAPNQLSEKEKTEIAQDYGEEYRPKTATEAITELNARQTEGRDVAETGRDVAVQRFYDKDTREKPPPIPIGNDGGMALDETDPKKMTVNFPDTGEKFSLDVPDTMTDQTAAEFRRTLDTAIVYNSLRKLGLAKTLFPGITPTDRTFRPQDKIRAGLIIVSTLGNKKPPGELFSPQLTKHLEHSLSMLRNPVTREKKDPDIGKKDLEALNLLQPDGNVNENNLILALAYAGDYPEEARTVGYEKIKTILWAGENTDSRRDVAMQRLHGNDAGFFERFMGSFRKKPPPEEIPEKKEPEETDENPEAAELLAEIVSEKGLGERDRRIIKSDPRLQHLLDDPDIVRVSFDSQGKIEQINNGFIAGVPEEVIRKLNPYLALNFRQRNTRNAK